MLNTAKFIKINVIDLDEHWHLKQLFTLLTLWCHQTSSQDFLRIHFIVTGKLHSLVHQTRQFFSPQSLPKYGNRIAIQLKILSLGCGKSPKTHDYLYPIELFHKDKHFLSLAFLQNSIQIIFLLFTLFIYLHCFPFSWS